MTNIINCCYNSTAHEMSSNGYSLNDRTEQMVNNIVKSYVMFVFVAFTDFSQNIWAA